MVVHQDGVQTGDYVMETAASGLQFLVPTDVLIAQGASVFDVAAPTVADSKLGPGPEGPGPWGTLTFATSVVPRAAKVEILATGAASLRFHGHGVGASARQSPSPDHRLLRSQITSRRQREILDFHLRSGSCRSYIRGASPASDHREWWIDRIGAAACSPGSSRLSVDSRALSASREGIQRQRRARLNTQPSARRTLGRTVVRGVLASHQGRQSRLGVTNVSDGLADRAPRN
jgi:hypothetical protein